MTIPMIGGKRLFGRSDEIKVLGYVATQFIHVWWFPILPMGSFFVWHGDERLCSPIRLRYKSVITIWLRAFCIWAGIATLIITLLSANEVLVGILHIVSGDSPGYIPHLVLRAAGIGLLFWYPIVGWWARSITDRRRAELQAELWGLPSDARSRTLEHRALSTMRQTGTSVMTADLGSHGGGSNRQR